MKTLHYVIIAMCVGMIFGGHSAFAQYGCPPVAGGWDPKIITSGESCLRIMELYFWLWI